MTEFLVVSSVVHKQNASGKIGGYGPYIREMNLWFKYVKKVIVVAPVTKIEFEAIDLAYNHSHIDFRPVPEFNLTSLWGIINAIWVLPGILITLLRAMSDSQHIHLRSPSNMGLLGCLTQLFFPNKSKTAKYAGNWDWNSKQPLSYRLQQLILRNTTLTKNIQVLVYGDWPDKTKNILPFFTATYWQNEIVDVKKNKLEKCIQLAFVGSLTESKSPLTSLEVCKCLRDNGFPVFLSVCGDGKQFETLEAKIQSYNLGNNVCLHGNVSAEKVKEVLQNAHFLVFISRSEGWPKAVVEAMFWGCVPITQKVSCVAQMVGEKEERGFLIDKDIEKISQLLSELFRDEIRFSNISSAAKAWSQEYTLERFEREIAKIL